MEHLKAFQLISKPIEFKRFEGFRKDLQNETQKGLKFCQRRSFETFLRFAECKSKSANRILSQKL